MNKTLDYISQELTRIVKSSQPKVINEYNQVILSTQKQLVIIPKQANSVKTSSGSRSV